MKAAVKTVEAARYDRSLPPNQPAQAAIVRVELIDGRNPLPRRRGPPAAGLVARGPG